MQAGDATQ